MRIKSGFVKTVIHLKIRDKLTGRLSFGYFSLAKQRKVTGVQTIKLIYPLHAIARQN